MFQIKPKSSRGICYFNLIFNRKLFSKLFQPSRVRNSSSRIFSLMQKREVSKNNSKFTTSRISSENNEKLFLGISVLCYDFFVSNLDSNKNVFANHLGVQHNNK